MEFHASVLLEEAVGYLEVEPRKRYIDATLGGGGHTFRILERGGKVLGVDLDEEAIEFTDRKWKIESRRQKIGEESLRLVQGNFKDIDDIAKRERFEKVSGILFDLGVSSHQLEKPERGFSFQKMGPLDMRMDPSKGSKQAVTAADLINGLTKGELDELFSKLGEEHFAPLISKSIIRARGIKPIETTTELAEIIKKAYPKKNGPIHPATKVFQALRIAVNDELDNIKEAMHKSIVLLAPNGRLVVISFHSLEDRIVKDVFRDFENNGRGKTVTKKPITPAFEEVARNPRSRSAKLRVFEKL